LGRGSDMTGETDGRKGSEADLRFALVALFPEPWQADIAVSLLASEGIRAHPADDWIVRKALFLSGVGTAVVVPETEAPRALEILRMAERGELSLAEEPPGYSEGSKRGERGNKRPLPGKTTGSRVRQQPSGGHPVVRCPRCGSENVARKGRLSAVFSRTWRCRVCRWEWKER